MKFVMYQKSSVKGNQWYWRLKSANGKIIADGAEGYKNRGDCQRMILKIMDLSYGAAVYVEDANGKVGKVEL